MNPMTPTPAGAGKAGKSVPINERKKIAGWAEMPFDRAMNLHGVRWLRVKDGMGGQGDREDWVADLPHLTVSVHDYHWRGQPFGPMRYKSMSAAMLGQLRIAVGALSQRVEEEEAKLTELRAALQKGRRLLSARSALAQAGKGKG